jgi:hypothetical protein
MLRLKAAGLGIKSIARTMGCSKNTVRRYLRGGGWVAALLIRRSHSQCSTGPERRQHVATSPRAVQLLTPI